MKRGDDGKVYGYQVNSVMMNTLFKLKINAVSQNEQVKFFGVMFL